MSIYRFLRKKIVLLTAAEPHLLFSGLELAKLRPRRWVRRIAPSPPADAVAIPRSSPSGGVTATVPAATGLAPGGLLNSTSWPSSLGNRPGFRS